MQVSLTPAKRDRKIAALREAITVIEAMPVVTPCSECGHFNHASAICRKWGAVVPPDVQKFGCEAWEEGVPF